MSVVFDCILGALVVHLVPDGVELFLVIEMVFEVLEVEELVHNLNFFNSL
jgi:hypothetical protein